LTDDQADLEACWPRLASEPYNITSSRCRRYNCLAWVAEDQSQWWEPEDRGGFYWPPGLPKDDFSLANYLAALRSLGFEICADGTLIEGVEKVAVYVDDADEFTHVAVQLDDGWWSSKLGHFNDVSHQMLESLLQGRPLRYGEHFTYMARARRKPSRPRSGLIVVERGRV
jgi:hypothetical protein